VEGQTKLSVGVLDFKGAKSRSASKVRVFLDFINKKLSNKSSCSIKPWLAVFKPGLERGFASRWISFQMAPNPASRFSLPRVMLELYSITTVKTDLTQHSTETAKISKLLLQQITTQGKEKYFLLLDITAIYSVHP